MQPMKPMEPIQPMKPMDGPDSSWWPKGLSNPSSSGSQNGVRYAFFAGQHRLAVEQDGKVKQYHTDDHHISGVRQAQGSQGDSVCFTSQNGDVDLKSLKEVH